MYKALITTENYDYYMLGEGILLTITEFNFSFLDMTTQQAQKHNAHAFLIQFNPI